MLNVRCEDGRLAMVTMKITNISFDPIVIKFHMNEPWHFQNYHRCHGNHIS